MSSLPQSYFTPGHVVSILPSGASPLPVMYAALLPMEWEGVGIPYTEMKLTLRQDLVIHKFVDRDGAYVEGTGRAPLQFEATCPFINTIDAGFNETWKQPLYPTNWRALMMACQEGETGILNHPELGAITCKVESCITTWRGTERGGPIVQLTWVETDDSTVNNQLNSALGQPSPISAANAACATMDANLGAISPAVLPTPPTFPTSFSQLMGQIAGIGEQAELLSYEFGGQISAIIYQCNSLETGLNATPNALNWPLFQAAEQAKDSLYTLQGNLLTTGQNISTWTTPSAMTIPAIATQLRTNLTLLLNLNPALALTPVVPARTLVRYYALAAAA